MPSKRPSKKHAAPAIDGYALYSNAPAEKSILSNLSRFPDELWKKANDLNLSSSHFYLDQHATLFSQLKKIYETHGPLDISAISGLIDPSTLESVGGISYLAEIYAYEATTNFWDHNAARLLECYARRITDAALRRALDDLKSGFIDPSDISRILDTITTATSSSRPYIPMGRHGDAFVYYVPARGELVTLAKNDHRPQALLSLAPLSYWETRYGELKVETAANECFTAQGNKLFSPGNARGIGAWKDGDTIIYSTGDRTISYTPGSPPIDVPAVIGSTIYERKAPITHPHNLPLTDAESAHIRRYFGAIPFYGKESPILAMGWIAISPLAGALKFRPHMWINATAGSGKSQLLDIIKHLLGSYALQIEGGTTEAGLRQTLRLDARAGIFDEAEANGESGIKALERILSYLRSCSTNEGGSILKGSTSGKALISSPRSMFLFASIGNQLERAADESRFATMRIRKIYDKDELNAHLANISSLRHHLYTPSFPARFIARILANAHVTLRNIDTIRTHLIEHGEPGRRADLMAPLLAGYLSLEHNKPVTPSELTAIHKLIKSSDIATIRETDEQRCLSHLLHYVTKEGYSIIELIESSWLQGDNCQDHATLKRHGIKIFRDEKMLAIADAHPKLSEAFEKTDWPKGWGRILRNVKDAKERCNVRFSSSNVVTKSTKLPLPDMSNINQQTSQW